MTLPVDADVLGLDRDAPLAFEVHRVEILRAHVAGVDRAGDLEDAIGQRRLAVVDVRDDREVADAGQIHVRPNAIWARCRSGWPPDRVAWLFSAGTLAPLRTTDSTREQGFSTAMANIKSQKKRNITNAKRHERNKSVKAEMQDPHQARRATLGTDDNDEAVRAAVKRIDSAASQGHHPQERRGPQEEPPDEEGQRRRLSVSEPQICLDVSTPSAVDTSVFAEFRRSIRRAGSPGVSGGVWTGGRRGPPSPVPVRGPLRHAGRGRPARAVRSPGRLDAGPSRR